MKLTSSRTPKKIAILLATAALFSGAALSAVACGGPTADGQHDSCETNDDCPKGNALQCLTATDGTKSCEIPCDATKPQGTACPLDQTCETETDFADPICYELPA